MVLVLMEQPGSMGVFPAGASLFTQTYLTLCPVLQEDTMEESGWKLVHGDVFRPPQYPMILSSLLGSGIQLFCMILIVICEWTVWAGNGGSEEHNLILRHSHLLCLEQKARLISPEQAKHSGQQRQHGSSDSPLFISTLFT